MFCHRSDHEERSSLPAHAPASRCQWLQALTAVHAAAHTTVHTAVHTAGSDFPCSQPSKESSLEADHSTFHSTEDPALPSSPPARLLALGPVCSHCISVIPASSWNRKYGKPFTWWEPLPGRRVVWLAALSRPLPGDSLVKRFV